MRTTWGNRELHLLEKLWNEYSEVQIKLIFDKLGYSRSLEAIQRQARRYYLGKATSAHASTKTFSPAEIAAIDAIVKTRTKTASRHAIDKKNNESDITSPPEVLKMLDKLRIETSKTKPKHTVQLSDGEIVVLCLSDIHYGAQIADDETGEVVYDTAIAERYISEIPEKLLQVLPAKKYAGIFLILAGDMIDGEEVYPTQSRHLDVSVIDQTRGLVKALWKTIKTLRHIFPCVCVKAVRGNHGRMSKSADERSNWDNVIYQQLELMADMEMDAHLEITHSFGEYLNFTVNGWRGHVRHIGVPHDGTAAMRSKLGSWHQMHNFDFMICAHLHHAGILNYNGKYVFRNGSIMVANDYAERIARRDPPRQIVFCVSKTTLPTFVNFINWP